MFNDVHFSSGKDDWATPKGLFEQYNNIYNFDLDVCATAFIYLRKFVTSD